MATRQCYRSASDTRTHFLCNVDLVSVLLDVLVLRGGAASMKYAPPGDQEEFYDNLRKACRTEAEEATLMLLWRTGMHASTLCSRDWVIVQDYCSWTRPKTGKYLRATLKWSEIKLILRCDNAGLLPASTSTLRRWVRRIGDRAGYAAVSPLTFRHSRAVWLLDEGIKPHRVACLLGCSYEVLEKHYAQLEAERLV